MNEDMKAPRVISILGSDYQILFRKEENDEKLKEMDGYFDFSKKLIVIADVEKDKYSVENLEVYRNKVLRHKIIHAFLYESGLWENSSRSDAWAYSEEMTDWIAIQSPKIFKVFLELGLI